MEHLWNAFYVFFGAVIATTVGIIGEKIKNYGKVYFELNSIDLEEILKKEDDGIGGKKDSEILESIKVHCYLDIINSSNEQKICRDIKIKIDSADKRFEQEYECFESEDRIHNHSFIFGKKFDTLNLIPNSVDEKYFFFYLKPPEEKTFNKDLLITYKDKRNRNKKYLLHNLSFEIHED